MVTNYYPPQQTQWQPQREPGMPRPLVAVIAAFTGAVSMLVIVVMAGAVANSVHAASVAPQVTETAQPEPAPTVTVTAEPEAAEEPTQAAEPEPAGKATTIDEGQWEVGEDVQAGTYKVVEPIDSGFCYWKITRHGHPSDIVGSDIVQGGRPTVTLKEDQDFTTNRCGTWERQ